MLRIPRCLDSLLTDGGEVDSLTRGPRCTEQKLFFSDSGTLSIRGLVIPSHVERM
jgi:hypothetical protein